MSFLAQPQNPSTANRRTLRQAPVSSNVLGTPWPTLWGERDLAGTVIAWTNPSNTAGSVTGKGSALASPTQGTKYYRTFALGLCLGAVDVITQVSFNNVVVWEGNITLADINTDPTNKTVGLGGVVISGTGHGTICFYLGTETQGQDQVLNNFVPNAPYYRGKCYAVFHGARVSNGTNTVGGGGWLLGNADQLPQIAIRVQRIPPAPPGLTWAAGQSPDAGNTSEELQHITLTLDASAWTGGSNIMYHLRLVPTSNVAVLRGEISILSGYDTQPNSFNVSSGVPFAVGSYGLMATATWGNTSAAVFNSPDGGDGWEIQVTSATTGAAGANIAGIVYELLTSNVHGIGLDPTIMDLAAFNAAATQSASVGVSYAGGEGSSERQDCRTLLTDLFQNWQAALCIRNGLIGPVLLIGSPDGTPDWTLQATDLVGVKQRPGAWYELPQHVTVKFRDVNRLFRDTTLSLPGAGDYGDDAANLEIDLPMITDIGVATLVGTRLRTLQALPQTPDVLTFGRGAFILQFGDTIAVNAPEYGLDSSFNWVVVGVREYGLGDERIELDLVPDIFGSLPSDSGGFGGGGGSTPSPTQPLQPIITQDAFELPWDFATDGSRRFTVFAARPQPNAAGFSLYASTETPSPTDFNEVDGSAVFSPGGTIQDAFLRGFTMDRSAYFDFVAASADIDSLTSVNDGDWWGYQMLILVGNGNTSQLYAASQLIFLGATSTSSIFRVKGLLGPLSDTLTYLPPGEYLGGDIWFFALQPPYNVLGQPSWTNGTVVTFKGIPFGSQLSSTLADAIGAVATVESRAIRPFPADNLVANGRGSIMGPTYATDINLSWVLRNRGFGFGYETNPSEFDPAIPTEIINCDVEVWVGGTLVRTAAAIAVRAGTVSTSIASGSWTPTSFSVASVAGLQPGDRIGVVQSGTDSNGNPWVDTFVRIASISGLTINLVSALPFTPAAGETVNRHESIGYVYDLATNQADNGGTAAASVLFKVYPNLNGLRSVSDAEITVVKQ